MNDVETIKTFYIRNSRTLEVVVVSSENETTVFYMYNYEGKSFRLFDSKIEVRKFFSCQEALCIVFINENDLDSYLLNYKELPI